MKSTTVRITSSTWKLLREISQEAGLPMQEIIQRAVEDYRRKLILLKTNDAYQKLKDDPKLWAEEVAERKEWEETLGDGLNEDE